ncbi:MAG: hypothetical protein Kow001_04620 [Acidobacteriota bacterium]
MALVESNAMDRILESTLSRLEGRALRRLAGSMPPWVSSDHLTILGVIGMVSAGILYACTNWTMWALWGVNAAIIVNWFGDSLDGTLARYRNRQRPRYGYYVDHMVDSLGATLLFLGLGLSPLMSMEVAVAALLAYLLLAINSYLAASTVGEFRLTFFALGPTELRILMMVGNLVVLAKPSVTILGHRFLFFDVGYAIGGISMLLTLIVGFTHNLRKLRTMEPL